MIAVDGLQATVESYVPGRIRVRLPREHRTEEVISQVRGVVELIDGVKSMSVNPLTGGVLLEYDPDMIDVGQLIELGRAARIIGTDLNAADSDELVSLLRPSEAAQWIIGSFARLNLDVSRLTTGLFDLKVLIPLGLLGLSLSRSLIGGKRAPAPWYTLLWYSYSMFMHWNNPARRVTPDVPEG